MYDLILEAGTVLSQGKAVQADVAVEGGTVVYVGDRPGGAARRRVYAGGRFVTPGFIDTHVHFRDPGHPHKEDWASGSRAAASGGVTTVCDMPNTDPPTVSVAAWEAKVATAQARSRVDFGVWIGAAAGAVDAARALADSGRACGIKVFMGASTGPLLVDDATLVTYFEHTRALMGVHAEDEAVLARLRAEWSGRTPPSHHATRPAEAATAAVRRLIELTEAFPRPVHVCHVSTAAELALLEAVRGRLPMTAEVSPHHLWLDEAAPLGNLGKVNPPLRPATDAAAMLAAFAGGRLDTVGSDHAPHTLEEKARPYAQAPAGLPGVETIFPLMLAAVRRGEFPLERVVDACAGAPARIFGMSRKGRVAVGADADLLVFGEAELQVLTAEALLTRVAWSPFLGRSVHPKPDEVYLRGALVASHGRIVGDDVRGRLVGAELA